MIIRPSWWQPSIVISWGLLVVGCAEAAVSQPAGAYSFGGLLFFWLLAWVAVHSIRMEVTEAAVTVKRGYLRSNTPRQVARSRLGEIHYYPKVINFHSLDGILLMRTRAEWSLRQMIKVAVELQVPLYDNRRCLHLLPTRRGRLVYSPVDGRPGR